MRAELFQLIEIPTCENYGYYGDHQIISSRELRKK